MSLPKLNDTPKHSVIIPSTGQKVRFRPFLVKEEKILMMAIESENQTNALNAVAETIDMCISENIDRDALKIFDIEYLFTKIRSKSVGESIPLIIGCSECKHQNPVDVDISNIEIEVPKVDNIIRLNSEISIEVEWPNYEKVINNKNITNSESDIGLIVDMAADSIVAIMTEDDRTIAKDQKRSDIIDFVESMDTDQFVLVQKYLEKMPRVTKEIKFKCNECETDNKISLENINDFF